MRIQLVCQYQKEETEFALKCQNLVYMFENDNMKFNEIFSSNLLPNINPDKSVRIFKIFLQKSQLPYEMIFILGKVMQAVAKELGDYLGKEPGEIDADTIIPYLTYVILKGISEVNREESKLHTEPNSDPVLYSQEHLINTCFKSRLLMIEFFTI